MLKKFLEIKKYEIITAENGLEGLNKVKLQPDIILLDVNMPKKKCKKKKREYFFHGDTQKYIFVGIYANYPYRHRRGDICSTVSFFSPSTKKAVKNFGF